MKTMVSKNGQSRAALAIVGEQRSPVLVGAVGTEVNLAIRYFRHLFDDHFSNVYFKAIDTTAQRQHPEVPPLPQDMFHNLAENIGVTQRLQVADSNPRNSKWITSEVTKMSSGRGGGAEPLSSRFQFEDGLNQIVDFMEPTLQTLVGPRRAEFAARRRFDAVGHAMTYYDPLQVYLLAGTSGATGALAELWRLVIEYILSSLGGVATYTLLLTLPSPKGNDSPSQEKRRRNTLGRLQELADSFAGKHYLYHPADNLIIEAYGPLYDSVFLMPEPRDGELDEHARFMAEYLRALLAPIGKVITDTVIDKTSLFRAPGPLGQPRFLSSANMVTLKATPFPIIPFAKSVLGELCTWTKASDMSAVADNFCRQQGFESGKLFSSMAPLTIPDASRINDKAAEVFLQNAAKKLSKEKNVYIQAAKSEFQKRIGDAEKEFLSSARKIVEEHGPKALDDYALNVSQRLEVFCTFCLEQKDLAVSQNLLSSGSLSERAQALATREESLAKQEHASFVAAALKPLIDIICDAKQKAVRRVTLVERARMKYQALRRELKHPAKHSILAADWLEAYIENKAKECLIAVHAIPWDLMDAEHFLKTLDAIIAGHADAFRHLERLDEAFMVAPEPAEEILDRTLAAAEPAVRVDPVWNVRRNASRLLFTTMPPDHPLAFYLRRTGREKKHAASTSAETEWLFSAVDCGLEIGALQATQEARKAYFADPDPKFPPFLDKAYKPISRLHVPPRDKWFAILSISVHRIFAKDTFTHRPSGFYFCGVYLGETYAEASENLTRQKYRNSQLPSFKELSEKTESLLLGDRPIRDAIEILKDIERRLQKQLAVLEGDTAPAAATERLVHDEELAVTEQLIARYTKFADDQERDNNIWNPGDE